MTDVPSFKPVGDTGLLVTLSDVADEAANTHVIALDHALAAAEVNGVKECIPALVNLLVHFDPLITDHASVEAAVRALFPLPDITASDTTTHIIPVCYDAELCPDLLATAEATGLPPEQVIAAHASARLRVSMYGFAPGYAYLSGLPPEIHVPRKKTALRDVPKGSILIAGAQSILTPLTMPTGWNIIGRSPAEVISGSRFLFDVGDTVTFTRIPRADLPEWLQT
ncbi:allophanate hydrolase subunit 1 [Rhodobacteraceae bacterium N5(2021)]|uniref:Allophanate hydrolase subunit 1 n=1 Tax=Gymnodinialimonas phycosphaerae TaxID=2841589 RepID=A0A975TZ21_9RHOB|nr:allophanate hydrolase subunit 1 [Gymnodinialimonas phycosphaerae]MBY4892665.1 allophanate hydrolase subunit 1 [Gymnodinialimonas phycosphaerae]